jgi:dimethylhistidine N-methyltransferase
VLDGLRAAPKHIPAKYFYDAVGSDLFERITEVPEYYPTRCEMSTLRRHSADFAKLIPAGAALVEFGSGSSKKARIVLSAAPKLAAYVPVDICGEMISARPPNCASIFRRCCRHRDICKPFARKLGPRPHVSAFSQLTIGNFEPHEAAEFCNAANILGEGATLIVGVDLIKPAEVLNAAYNDAEGVTEKFNLNLLTRINRELGGNFRPDMFEHHAFYNREKHRIEMHLASLKRQKVRVAGETIDFRAGETIHTENSYKYSIESLGALARGAGWLPAGAWTDFSKYFSIQAFTLGKSFK